MPNPIKLAGVKGGPKSQWLKKHQDLVIQYYEEFGNEATRRRFHLKQCTLDTVLIAKLPRPYHKITHAEVAELKSDTALSILNGLTRQMEQLEHQVDCLKTQMAITAEARREETQSVTQLHEAFYGFTDEVSDYLAQGMKQVIKLLLEQGINPQKRLPPAPPKPDLNLDSLVIEGKRVEASLEVINSTPDNPLLETIARIERGNK